MLEHASSNAGGLGLFIWIFFGALFADSCAVHHSIWYRLVGSLAGGDDCFVLLGSPQCGSTAPVVGRWASQGSSHPIGHLGDAHYFLALSQILVLSL